MLPMSNKLRLIIIILFLSVILIGCSQKKVLMITPPIPYAQLCYHNHTPTPISFSEANVFYNMTLTNFTLNGFTESTNSVIAEIDGLYFVTYFVITTGVNNHEYIVSSGVNGITKTCAETHKKLTSGGDILTMSGKGIIRIKKGDVITLMITDYAGTGDGTYYGGNLILMRVDD